MKELVARQCVRQYSDKKISNEEIEEILEAGRLAPSWMNVQPWKFIVVEDEEHVQTFKNKLRKHLTLL